MHLSFSVGLKYHDTDEGVVLGGLFVAGVLQGAGVLETTTILGVP